MSRGVLDGGCIFNFVCTILSHKHCCAQDVTKEITKLGFIWMISSECNSMTRNEYPQYVLPNTVFGPHTYEKSDGKDQYWYNPLVFGAGRLLRLRKDVFITCSYLVKSKLRGKQRSTGKGIPILSCLSAQRSSGAKMATAESNGSYHCCSITTWSQQKLVVTFRKRLGSSAVAARQEMRA